MTATRYLKASIASWHKELHKCVFASLEKEKTQETEGSGRSAPEGQPFCRAGVRASSGQQRGGLGPPVSLLLPRPRPSGGQYHSLFLGYAGRSVLRRVSAAGPFISSHFSFSFSSFPSILFSLGNDAFYSPIQKSIYNF